MRHLPTKLATLIDEVMKVASKDTDLVSARYATRQIDNGLKRVTIGAKDLATLQNSYSAEIAMIDPNKLFSDFRTKLTQGIVARDLVAVLALYDNKGLAAIAAHVLGVTGPKELMEKVGKLLSSASGEKLRDEVGMVLPSIAN